MHPVIKNGDRVCVQPVPIDKVRVGDIVLSQDSSGICIMHRVIKKSFKGRDTVLMLKGDAMRESEKINHPQGMLGKVVLVERGSKKIRLDTAWHKFFGRAYAKTSIVSWARYAFHIGYHIAAIIEPWLSRIENLIVNEQREEKFLIKCVADVCSQREFSPPDLKYFEEAGPFNWPYLYKYARTNGVAPFLFLYLKAWKKIVPTGVWEKVEKEYYETLIHNLLIQRKISPLLDSLDRQSIQIILLKGIVLSETIYASPGLRPMTDVDILIREKELLRANRILNNFGFFARNGNPLTAKRKGITPLTTYDYRNEHISLHIHQHPVNASVPNFSYISKIDIERIFRYALPLEIAGGCVLAPGPEHLIILLCEHGMRVRHSLSKLIFFADIAAAIYSYRSRIDWSFMTQETVSFGLERIVYPALFAANQLLGIDAPCDVLANLKPDKITAGEKIFLSKVLAGKASAGLSYLVHLAMNRNITDKMKFLFLTFFPPAEVVARRNYISSSKVTPFHYLSRAYEILSHIP